MEERDRNERWQGRAAKLFCLLAVLGILWLTVRLAGAVLWVLLIAWSVAAVIAPLAQKTHRVLHVPRRLCAALYVFLGLSLVLLLGFLAVRQLTKELRELLHFFEENQELLLSKLDTFLNQLGSLSQRLPFLSAPTSAENGQQVQTAVDAWASDWIKAAIGNIGSLLTTGVGRLLQALPRMLITLVVTVMACLYLSMDYQQIRDRLIGLLPHTAADRVHALRPHLRRAIRSYLRAYLLLFLLTFLEILIGMLLLRQKYALLIAFLIALVDILPVLGAGTVLIPWAIVLLLLKQYSVGFGLLILYGIVTVVRQIVEPHAVGGHLGLHPLLSLLAMFTGFQLFGIPGMLLGPAVAMLLKEYLRFGKESLETNEKNRAG